MNKNGIVLARRGAGINVLRLGVLLAFQLPIVNCQLSTASAQNADSIRQSAPEVVPVKIADGPCQPTWKSLGDHFRTPTWFRKAKIGIWLHWGPQSVGEEGDWYAKWIYMPKHAWGNYTRVYSDHLKQVGHPSVEGYKDMLPRWKAAKWRPDELMKLYRAAGARYVIAQGMHHDNFDLWDSRYQPWNSVRIGPHRDIVAGWKKAADKEHMRFGIAFHGDYSLFWYQPAFLSDLEGPLKGVPYDGAQNYDGKRTWWKDLGLNLKDLYGIDLKEDVVWPKNFHGDSVDFRMTDPLSHGIPDGNLRKHLDFARWYCQKWTHRVIDAIDRFSPDFIYFDGGGSYPFCGWFTGRGYRSDATPRVIAHLYNRSMQQHGGKLEAMAFAKGNEDVRAIAFNSESNVPAGIKRDQPWQCENGIGEWFYIKGIFYDPGMVIHELVEAISRDGNYVINVPLTPDGTLDEGGVQTLQEMGRWMKTNGKAVYDSYAWRTWGEGNVVMAGGGLSRTQAATPYTGQDLRFTTRDGKVYVFLMAWPESGRVIIRSLADDKVGEIKMLGASGKLSWKKVADGVEVTLPARKPCKYVYCLKVQIEK